MTDYEKLGVFYLGRTLDAGTGKPTDQLLLYDSKDLTTHAVIIGMTGSGKTGLGIDLLEEAAMDKIPVIAIDPKGDLGNILLTFPELRGADFAPWVNRQEAEAKGEPVERYADGQAQAWREGLAQWDQSGERIRALKANAEFALYTPGSTAGTPISVLRAFSAPPAAVRDDADLYRDRLQATVTSVLGMVGIEGDPLQSREHILLSAILDAKWKQGADYDLAGLIAALQQPPVQRVGVMDLEAFFPAKDRFALAMRLNGLLAAPGFEAWLQGAPLDAGRLLYTESGKPRVAVISIAHLQDNERMFFVSLLLAELVSWMRTQPGTGSLRAILYMDELFGYMPPVANPPSKPLFLTLLKQARAYGLGLVLATQNPVDLDYKGLSNTGTWFIGRLQTERDKARVMDGLEGASGGRFDRAATERLLASLGKRVFYMHSVHEPEPVLFTTRWTMSYLAGPMTREQIKQLKAPEPAATAAAAAPTVAAAAPSATAGARPVMPPGVPQYFLPTNGTGITYRPMLVAAAQVTYTNAKYGVDESREVLQLVEIVDGPIPVDFATSRPLAGLAAADLAKDAEAGARFEAAPAAAADPKQYPKWTDLFERWARQNLGVTLWRCAELKAISQPDEAERDFRIRLQTLAREQRDAAVAKLRQKYEAQVRTAQSRVERAQVAQERERSEATQAKMDTAISAASAVLGALFGRKTLSASTVSRVGTAARSVGRAQKQSADVARAGETIEAAQAALAELQTKVEQEAAALDSGFDAAAATLDAIAIKPKASDVQVHFVALAWAPHLPAAGGGLAPAWA